MAAMRQFKIRVHCQSCFMQMEDGDYGTRFDSSPNDEYCYHCFHNGQFREPHLTLTKMEERVVERMLAEQPRMLKTQAEERAHSVIPHLKRWRTE